MADTKELEDKIASLTKELEAVKAKPEVKLEVPKELTDQMTAMATRIKELESKPAAPVAASIVQERELGTVDFVAIYDKRAGTIKSV